MLFFIVSQLQSSLSCSLEGGKNYNRPWNNDYTFDTKTKSHVNRFICIILFTCDLGPLKNDYMMLFSF